MTVNPPPPPPPRQRPSKPQGSEPAETAKSTEAPAERTEPNLAPEVREVKPFVFLDGENSKNEVLDLSPKYMDPKEVTPVESKGKGSEEVRKAEDSTEKGEALTEEDLDMILTKRDTREEYLKLITNS